MGITVAKGADTYAETITGGALHTNGAWVQLHASTPEAVAEVRVNLVSSNANRDYLVDLGTGAGGAEAVLINDMIFDVGDAVRTSNPVVSMSVNIPSSTRVAARCQANSATSNSVRISVHLIGGTVSPSNPVTYGAVPATTSGTTVDSGAVVDTKGAYAQLTAATSEDHDVFAVMVASRGNTAMQSVFFDFDLATGAGGAESIQLPDLCIGTHATGDPVTPTSVTFPLSITSGTRIAMRSASGTTDATDRLLDTVVIGGRLPSTSGGGGLIRHPGMAGGMAA